jgi:hypothetical protein
MKRRAETGAGHLLNTRVGKEQIALVLVEIGGPGNPIVWAKPQRGAGRAHSNQVSVSGENGVGPDVICIGADEIAHVSIRQLLEALSRNAFVRRAHEDFRGAQLVRKRPQMPEGRIKIAADIGGSKEFPRPAGVGGNFHRKSAVMVVRKNVEGYSNLFQVADALGAFGTALCFGNDGQKQ